MDTRSCQHHTEAPTHGYFSLPTTPEGKSYQPHLVEEEIEAPQGLKNLPPKGSQLLRILSFGV